MTDVVLVHGTTQDASGFAGLRASLEEAAHRVLSVEVHGGCESTAAGYADRLAAQLPDDMVRPVVFAHSGAGLLLPALAHRLDARRQVWFAAAVADYANGCSLLDELVRDPDAVLMPEWKGIDPTSDPVLATYFLFHDANLQELRAGLRSVKSCDISALYHETPRFDPSAVPSTYILPQEDRTLRQAWMRRVAEERLGVAPWPMACGHNGYVARPDAVAEIVLEAVFDEGDDETAASGIDNEGESEHDPT